MTEDEMVGFHHQPDGREFEQAPGEKTYHEQLSVAEITNACFEPANQMVSDHDLLTAKFRLKLKKSGKND